MDKKEKLFRKINKKDRMLIRAVVLSLKCGEIDKLNIKKLSGSEFYRLRKGRFRIIFHYESKILIIDSIKLRKEITYKNIN